MAAPKKKVAYLFGAGATHAELFDLEPNIAAKRQGLLIGNVSSRVIEKARTDPDYLLGLELVSATSGSLNIELLISLIEDSKIHGWARKTQLLKQLVENDIKAILTSSRTNKFYLHKALFELHGLKVVSRSEDLIGLISLNYDGVLDQAYSHYHGEPNYCFSLKEESKSLPLLKLHGSFTWSDKKPKGLRRSVDIIPLGSNKTYLHVPYGAIWNKALQILIECDTLRVIGCSLSPNDTHLIDLLFKAHLERDVAFEIEIIATDSTGEKIQTQYGFFPKIRTLVQIEGLLVPEKEPDNAYKTWLKYKSLKMLGPTKIRKSTVHLKKVIS